MLEREEEAAGINKTPFLMLRRLQCRIAPYLLESSFEFAKAEGNGAAVLYLTDAPPLRWKLKLISGTCFFIFSHHRVTV